MKLKLVCAILLLLCSMHLFAASNYDSQKSIKDINRSIQKIQKQLSKDTNQRDQLNTVLKSTEVTMGELDKQLHDINKQLTKENKVLTSLNTKQKTYQNQLKQQQAALASEMKTLYYLQNHNYFQTLLNQSDTENFSRNITYFKYFNHSRLQSMKKIEQTLDEIKRNQQKIQQQTTKLTEILQGKRQRQKQLQQLVSARNTVLAQLNQNISSNERKLSSLQKDKVRLEQLLNQLKQRQGTPIQPPLPFASMRGKLNWPTKGKVTEHYNTPIGSSELKSSGVLIDGPTGQDVHAIYPGKVVFANWLKGFGLLMIIDHGDGYMTLYARNNALFYKVGDFVSAGDVIAQVGNTGGYQQSGLYFEIRKHGNPVNPERWCK